MWSLAVEVAFYVALPLLAYLLLVVLCRRRWRPRLLLAGLVGLALITPGVAGAGAHHRLFCPTARGCGCPPICAWFTGRHGAGGAAGDGRAVVRGFVPAARAGVLFHRVHPDRRGAHHLTAELCEALVKAAFFAVIAVLMVAPLALGNRGWYARVLASRPMVWLGEISYEIFLIHLMVMEVAMVEVLRWRVYTGDDVALFVVTLVMTIPVAWLLHRFTRVRS